LTGGQEAGGSNPLSPIHTRLDAISFTVDGVFLVQGGKLLWATPWGLHPNCRFGSGLLNKTKPDTALKIETPFPWTLEARTLKSIPGLALDDKDKGVRGRVARALGLCPWGDPKEITDKQLAWFMVFDGRFGRPSNTMLQIPRSPIKYRAPSHET
jgi:hypothetical protein